MNIIEIDILKDGKITGLEAGTILCKRLKPFKY